MNLTISLEVTCDDHAEPVLIYSCTIVGGSRTSVKVKIDDLQQEALDAVAEHGATSHGDAEK